MTSVYKWYKLARVLYKKRIPLLPKFITYLIRFIFGAYIPHTADIGRDTVFGYGGIGVVIHSRSKIGNRCIISQGVTLGGTSHIKEVPIIGNDVYIGAGAKIIGPVKIGDEVIIGANAVVVDDVESKSIVAGVPAKVVKRDINIEDYI